MSVSSKAVVLLSGGLDSAVTLAVAKKDFEPHCLSFDYGQLHRIELDRAEAIVEGLPWRLIKLDTLGRSTLLGDKDVVGEDGIPATWVPARNLIFLSQAAAYAKSIDAYDIFIGVNVVDYSGYRDCRPEFIEAAEDAINAALTDCGVSPRYRIHTPLIHKSKAEIIELGAELGVDFSRTHSCYFPVNNKACGVCDSCKFRLKGFDQAGIKDPVEYVDLKKD